MITKTKQKYIQKHDGKEWWEGRIEEKKNTTSWLRVYFLGMCCHQLAWIGFIKALLWCHDCLFVRLLFVILVGHAWLICCVNCEINLVICVSGLCCVFNMILLFKLYKRQFLSSWFDYFFFVSLASCVLYSLFLFLLCYCSCGQWPGLCWWFGLC